MATTDPFPKVLLIGDSIVEYSSNLNNGGYAFGAGLQEHCARRLEVVNRGLSGYNTDNILFILSRLIPAPSVDKVQYLLILFGANDACLPASPKKQHVPLDKYRANLKAIITHPAVRAQQPRILLVTPPPINEVHLEAEDLKRNQGLTREQAVTARYAEAVRSVAAEYADSSNVVLVDLWSAIMGEAQQRTPGYERGTLVGSKGVGDSAALRDLLVDGLHLTKAGYEIFLKEVRRHIGQGWVYEDEENPSWVFPHWTCAPKIP